MYRFDISTVQADQFKTLIEALKEILTDTNIEFNKDGIKISAMNPTRSVMAHLRLHNDKFEKYECSRETRVGISLINFYKIISGITNQHTLRLFMLEDDPNTLHIEICNSDKKEVCECEFKLMDVPQTKWEVGDIDCFCAITMPSEKFQRVCRNLDKITDKICIQNAGNEIRFESHDCDYANVKMIMTDQTEGVSFQVGKDYTSTQVVSGKYDLKYFVLFTKCAKLCNNIQIYISIDNPIAIVYSVGSLGELRVLVASEIDDSTAY